jgi:hypothetical protein
MAIQTVILDPNAQSYTNDEIVAKMNAASTQITRAGSVAAAARPIADGEVSSAKIGTGAAKANLDAMADVDRGYVKTAPTTGQYPVISVQRASDGKIALGYDDVPK